MNRKSIQMIQHPELPADIRLGVTELPLPVGEKSRNRFRDVEKKTGRNLIKRIAEDEFQLSNIRLDYQENGKPVAICDQWSLHLSIAHSKSLVCGAVSQIRNVGVDIEQENRNVVGQLPTRIRHPMENDALYELPVLQIWTLKEAVLKWSGSGLRVAMRKILIQSNNNSSFMAELSDGKKVKVCCFKKYSHWISVAF